MGLRVGIVCGFGCHLKPEVKFYLDRVAQLIDDYKLDIVISSGGYSQKKSAPNISEANVIDEYLRRSRMGKRGVSFFLEYDSLTTFENIRNGTRKLKDAETEVDFLVVFTDSLRALRVKFLVDRFFPQSAPGIPIVLIEGIPVITSYRGAADKQLIFTFIECLSYYLPPLQWVLRKIREKRAERI